MIKRGQSGFSAVEAILILVIAGILGFVGWYVWDTKTISDKTYEDTQSVKEVNEKAEESAIQPSKKVVGYLEIKEWGVKLPLTAEIKDATYEIGSVNRENPGPYAFLSTREVDSSPVCQKYYAPLEDYNFPSFQDIQRFSINDKVPIDEDTLIPATEAENKDPEHYQRVGDFVYRYMRGNGMPCEEESPKIEPAFQRAFLNISAA